MTSTQSMPNAGLTAEADDDQMEMGMSPYPQVDDIDFDLDDQQDQFVEDNSMVDDATDNMDSMQADNSTANQDDIMYDEDPNEEVIDFEDDFDMNAEDAEVFEQEPFQPLEDHTETSLTNPDASTIEGEIDASTQAPAQDTNTISTEEKEQLDFVQKEEDTNIQQLGDNTSTHDVPAPDPTEQEHDALGLDNVTSNQSATEIVDFAAEAPLEAKVDENSSAVLDSRGEIALDQPGQGSEEAADVNALPNDEDGQVATNEVIEEAEQEEQQSQFQESSAPLLHPVMVQYDGQHYPLFPLEDGDATKVLLSDAALASGPINVLLKELQTPFGGYLGHDDEIVFDIPSLGLHICEDSRYAEELTLAQIIDTYMLLSQNQQLSQIEPLYCQLSHRACLKTQMNYLITSAREGKTFATIVEEHVGSPEEGAPDGEVKAFADETEYYDVVGEVHDQEGDEHEHPNGFQDSEQVQLAQTGENKEAEQEGGEEDKETDQVHDVNAHASAESEGQVNIEEHVSADKHETKDAESPEYVPEPHIVQPDEDSTGASLVHTVQEAKNQTSELDPPAEIDYNGDEFEDEEYDPDLQDEEDLFADDAQEPENPAYEEYDGDDVYQAQGSQAGDEEFNFESWENEEGPEIETVPKVAPTTPSKAINGKRKLIEEDDELDIDLSTPEPKRTRSS